MTEIWQRRDRFLEMRSRWFTLLGEQWLDHQGHLLEYWRVERAHSVIVLPLQAGQIVLPPPMFRPGIGTATYDFPGGRLPAGESPKTAMIAILQRELGVDATAILHCWPLNPEGWAINSSFSDQHLYGWVAQLDDQYPIPSEQIGYRVTADAAGMHELLQVLTCLQCRAVLLEWFVHQRAQQDSNL